jgi:ribosomal protein S18 acetylase RimI-like enzyme
MQWTAQKQHYAAEHPQAVHDIILMDGIPVGRLYLDRQAETLHILDVTVLPEHRNAGAGTFLLRQILDKARQAGKAVTIYVESFNPSLRLFERLGFVRAQEKGIHYLMKWLPQG